MGGSEELAGQCPGRGGQGFGITPWSFRAISLPMIRIPRAPPRKPGMPAMPGARLCPLGMPACVHWAGGGPFHNRQPSLDLALEHMRLLIGGPDLAMELQQIKPPGAIRAGTASSSSRSRMPLADVHSHLRAVAEGSPEGNKTQTGLTATAQNPLAALCNRSMRQMHLHVSGS